MSRLQYWGLLLTCSVVSMLAIVTTLDKRNETKWERYERWIMSVTCISICVSFIGGLVSCLPPQQALKYEHPFIVICLAFWSAGLPAIMDPENELGVGAGGGILNANLYFFSWGSLIVSIMLAGEWGKQFNGDDASITAVQWVCLAASSLVLMGTSSATYNELGCGKAEDSTTVCNRNLFAIILGVCSGVIALVMVPLKGAPPICQGVISLLLLICWACGVSYITFDNGPGSSLGNVYFATWISLFLCVNITSTCLMLLLHGKDGPPPPQQQQAAAPAKEESERSEPPAAENDNVSDVSSDVDDKKPAKSDISSD